MRSTSTHLEDGLDQQAEACLAGEIFGQNVQEFLSHQWGLGTTFVVSGLDRNVVISRLTGSGFKFHKPADSSNGADIYICGSGGAEVYFPKPDGKMYVTIGLPYKAERCPGGECPGVLVFWERKLAPRPRRNFAHPGQRNLLPVVASPSHYSACPNFCAFRLTLAQI